MFHTTFNNFSATSLQSALLMEEIDDDHPRYIPAKFDSIYHNGFTEENQNLKKKKRQRADDGNKTEFI